METSCFLKKIVRVIFFTSISIIFLDGCGNTITSDPNTIASTAQIDTGVNPQAVQKFTFEAKQMTDETKNWEIKLTWENIPKVDSYTIEYGDKSPVKTSHNTTVNLVTSPFTISNLKAGSTLYFVVVAVATVNNVQVNIPSQEFSVKIPLDVYTEVPGPFNLSAVAGDQKITLTWTDSARATFYAIYSGSKSGGPYETTVASLVKSPYVDEKNLTNGVTRYYLVRAINSKGSTDSTFEVAVTPNKAPNPLGEISLVGGNSNITLSWNAVSFASKYRIQRGIVPGVYQDPAFEVTQPASLPAQVTYVDTGLSSSLTYYYLVSAVNDIATISGQEVSGSPSSSFSGPSPGVFSASVSPGDNRAVLTWGTSSDATSYSIYRGTVSGTYDSSPLVSNQTGLTYTDTTAVTGVQYYYLVSALNNVGTRSAAEVSTTPFHTPLPFTVNLTGNASQVSLTWDSAVGASSYTVRRKLEGGAYSSLAQNLTNLVYVDSALTPGATYFYLILATNINGSTTSNEITSTIPVSVIATGANSQVNLVWSAPSGSTATYSISRGIASGVYDLTPIVTGLNTTEYSDSGLTNGTVYYYRITTHLTGGDTINAQEVFASPQNIVLAPQLFYRLGVSSGNAVNIRGVLTDSQGNVYTVGSAWGTFNGITPPQYADAYISKRDSNGTVLWTHLMPYYSGRAETYGYSLCNDGIGNVYVVGTTSDGQQWSSTLPIWAKFDANGNQQWLVLGAAVGVGGYYAESKCVANADGTKLFTAGYSVWGDPGRQAYVASINPANGQQVWRVPISGVVGDARGISLDSSDNVYLCGRTSGNQHYLAKYDSLGANVFMDLRGPNGLMTSCSSILQDGANNMYLIGDTTGSIESVTAPSSKNIFVSKFTNAGTHLSTSILGASGVSSLDVQAGILDNSNNAIYITGRIVGDFAGQVSSSAGFFTRYSVNTGVFDQKLQWELSTDANGNTTGPIALDTVNNRIYVPIEWLPLSAVLLGSTQVGIGGSWWDHALIYIPRQ